MEGPQKIIPAFSKPLLEAAYHTALEPATYVDAGLVYDLAGMCRNYGTYVNIDWDACIDEQEIDTCETLGNISAKITSSEGWESDAIKKIDYDGNMNRLKICPADQDPLPDECWEQFQCEQIGLFYGLYCQPGETTCKTREDKCEDITPSQADDAPGFNGGLRCKYINGCVEDPDTYDADGIPTKCKDGALSAIAVSLIGIVALLSF